MPKLSAEQTDVFVAEGYLEDHAELSHLRVKKRGATLTFVSGPEDAPIQHLRLRKVTRQWWTPDAPAHSGRWESLPIRARISEALESVRTEFPWLLVPRD